MTKRAAGHKGILLAPLLGLLLSGCPGELDPTDYSLVLHEAKDWWPGPGQSAPYDDALLLRRQADGEGWLLLKNRAYPTVYHYDTTTEQVGPVASELWDAAEGFIVDCRRQRSESRELHVDSKSHLLHGPEGLIETSGAIALEVSISPSAEKAIAYSADGPIREGWGGMIFGRSRSVGGARYHDLYRLPSGERAGPSHRLPYIFTEESAWICWSQDEQFVVYRRSQTIDFAIVDITKETPFTALRPGGRLTGRFVDRGPTEFDRVGKIRVVGLDVEVEVETPATYRIKVRLAADGERRITLNTETELTAGRQNVPLEIRSRDFRSTGFDGAYSIDLIELAVRDKRAFRPIDRATDLGWTRAYAGEDMARSPIAGGRNIRETPWDDDQDGRYDRIVVIADVAVGWPDDFHWGLTLLDQDGTPIASGTNNGFLEFGVQSVEVSFDGGAISAAGQDGPYGLADFFIRGPVGLSRHGSIAETRPYRADQFKPGPELIDLVLLSGTSDNELVLSDQAKRYQVALLSRADLPADRIDPTHARLFVALEKDRFSGHASDYRADRRRPVSHELRDVNGDGRADLVLAFDLTQQDWRGRDGLYLVVQARTNSGAPLRAVAPVSLVYRRTGDDRPGDCPNRGTDAHERLPADSPCR